MICPKCKAVQAIGNRCSDCGTTRTVADINVQEIERARRYRAKVTPIVLGCILVYVAYHLVPPLWQTGLDDCAWNHHWRLGTTKTRSVVVMNNTDRIIYRALARVLVAHKLGLEPQEIRQLGNDTAYLVLKVPKDMPLRERVAKCMQVWQAGIVAEEMQFGEHTGAGLGEVENILHEFGLDKPQ